MSFLYKGMTIVSDSTVRMDRGTGIDKDPISRSRLKATIKLMNAVMPMTKDIGAISNIGNFISLLRHIFATARTITHGRIEKNIIVKF